MIIYKYLKDIPRKPAAIVVKRMIEFGILRETVFIVVIIDIWTPKYTPSSEIDKQTKEINISI